MKTIKTFFLAAFILGMAACSSNKPKLLPGQLDLRYHKVNPHEQILEDILSGMKFSDDTLTREAYKMVFQFQKRAGTKEDYGSIISKSFLTTALNGTGNVPLDKTNYDKWDFMVVYNGLYINSVGDENLKPVVLFYKADSLNALVPAGRPVRIIMPGGGGGDGTTITNPPPRLPTH
jgi:hypothetical protein